MPAPFYWGRVPPASYLHPSPAKQHSPGANQQRRMSQLCGVVERPLTRKAKSQPFVRLRRLQAPFTSCSTRGRRNARPAPSFPLPPATRRSPQPSRPPPRSPSSLLPQQLPSSARFTHRRPQTRCTRYPCSWRAHVTQSPLRAPVQVLQSRAPPIRLRTHMEAAQADFQTARLKPPQKPFKPTPQPPNPTSLQKPRTATPKPAEKAIGAGTSHVHTPRVAATHAPPVSGGLEGVLGHRGVQGEAFKGEVHNGQSYKGGASVDGCVKWKG